MELRNYNGAIRHTRTLNEAFSDIQRIDPGTAITKTALRRLVTTGQIPSVRIGTKYLVCLEDIFAHFSGGNKTPIHATGETGGVRRLGVI